MLSDENILACARHLNAGNVGLAAKAIGDAVADDVLLEAWTSDLDREAVRTRLDDLSEAAGRVLGSIDIVDSQADRVMVPSYRRAVVDFAETAGMRIAKGVGLTETIRGLERDGVVDYAERVRRNEFPKAVLTGVTFSLRLATLKEEIMAVLAQEAGPKR